MSVVSSSNDIPVYVECGTEEEEISTNKKECTSCEQKIDDAPCELLNDMSIRYHADSISTCANCGKESSDVKNTCNKCKSVKYCNAACKKKHRHKHKKDCEEHQRLAAEHAAKLHDVALFKQPPPNEDCPICFLLLPTLDTGRRYKSCCGKLICSGCVHAVRMRDGDVGLCPFCRTPAPKSNDLHIKRLKNMMEAGDTDAMINMGVYYAHGMYELPQNHAKALELYHQAAELGNAPAYGCIANCYNNGRGIGMDKKMAIHYYELAAMKGLSSARSNLGEFELESGNIARSLTHYMIAVKMGCNNSLKAVKLMFENGLVTKEGYTTSLRTYQEYLNEIKSDQRDKAAAYDEEYKYY